MDPNRDGEGKVKDLGRRVIVQRQVGTKETA